MDSALVNMENNVGSVHNDTDSQMPQHQCQESAMDLTSVMLFPPRNSRTQMSAISLDLATERNLPPTWGRRENSLLLSFDY